MTEPPPPEHQPIISIDIDREHGNLFSAIRLFVLNHYQTRMALPNQSFMAINQQMAINQHYAAP